MTYGVFDSAHVAATTVHSEFPYDSRFERIDSFRESYEKFAAACQRGDMSILVINTVCNTTLTVVIPHDG